MKYQTLNLIAQGVVGGKIATELTIQKWTDKDTDVQVTTTSTSAISPTPRLFKSKQELLEFLDENLE
jgi:hypothetical protein